MTYNDINQSINSNKPTEEKFDKADSYCSRRTIEKKMKIYRILYKTISNKHNTVLYLNKAQATIERKEMKIEKLRDIMKTVTYLSYNVFAM